MKLLDEINEKTWNYTNDSERLCEILERKRFSRTHISEPENDKFPSTAKLMNTLNRPRGSSMVEGDYEMMVLLLLTKGEDTMWEYLNKRLDDILAKAEVDICKGM